MACKPLLLSLALQRRSKPQQQANSDPMLMSLSEEEMATARDIISEVNKIKMW